ncbi:hypothetical protein GPJ56_009247 [Histomonas meleagridis]|uniref:uncharacterized protein n=1 Tax=Histomonas meleagridis TaxID=135588 RepID=UPI00355A3987|nr:hypothetical protein GPJ56_009247 [Histomonas meleagridis]KAH0801618.1 hypothetical protein GO595_005617 [Histomonas meleagridis]
MRSENEFSNSYEEENDSDSYSFETRKIDADGFDDIDYFWNMEIAKKTQGSPLSSKVLASLSFKKKGIQEKTKTKKMIKELPKPDFLPTDQPWGDSFKQEKTAHPLKEEIYQCEHFPDQNAKEKEDSLTSESDLLEGLDTSNSPEYMSKSKSSRKIKRTKPTTEAEHHSSSATKGKNEESNSDYMSKSAFRLTENTKVTKRTKTTAPKPSKPEPLIRSEVNTKIELQSKPPNETTTETKPNQRTKCKTKVSPKSNSSDNTIQKDVTRNDDQNDDNDLPIALRRKKRIHLKPLRYWLGEKLVYKPDDSGLYSIEKVVKVKTETAKATTAVKVPKTKKKITIPINESYELPTEDFPREIMHIKGIGVIKYNKRNIKIASSNVKKHPSFTIPANRSCTIRNTSENSSFRVLISCLS